MKFTVTLKDPDVLDDAINDAVDKSFPEGLSEEEKELLADGRREEYRLFAGKWMKYGEYLTVEFDTEAGTALLLPKS